MHRSFWLMTIALMTGCNVFVQDQRPPLRLVEATQQKFIGGAPGAGTSTHYKFKLLQHTEKPITIDTIWIDSLPLQPRFLKQQDKTGDTLLINVVRHHKSKHLEDIRKRNKAATNAAQKGKTTPSLSPPRPYKGAALISYKSGKKKRKKYLEVPAFKNLETIAFP